MTSRHARRRLRSELAQLTSKGAQYLLIEPDRHLKDVLRGFPRREPGRLSDILDVARGDVERALLRSETVLG